MNEPEVTLSDGNHMPRLGYGLGGIPVETAPGLVGAAIDSGYRLIDTAAKYGNEAQVGQAIAASDVPRADLFITTKCWPDRFGFDEIKKSFAESLARLGLEQLDLYLLHWPAPALDLYVESWKALIDLQADGLVKSIGVSNFFPDQIERIAGETGIMPVINQLELHPFYQRHDQRAYHKANDIVTECWSPLGRSRCLAHEMVTRLAKKHQRTPAQIILRFMLDQGLVVIPRSSNPDRIAANFAVGGFELEASDVAELLALDMGIDGKNNPDPDIAA